MPSERIFTDAEIDRLLAWGNLQRELRFIAAAPSIIKQLRQHIEHLEICELCDVKIPWESFNVCGGCHNKEIEGLRQRIVELEGAIHRTLNENGHLADGDVCTLIHIKRVVESITIDGEGEKRDGK